MKRLLPILILAVLAAYGCNNDNDLPDITIPLDPPDSLLEVAGIDRAGFTDLEGPIPDSDGRLYLFGQKNEYSWFGVFENGKMIFSKSFSDDPTMADVGYGETASVSPAGIGLGVQTEKVVAINRTIRFGGRNTLIAYVGQTIYNKETNKIIDYLYKSDKDYVLIGNNQIPLIWSYRNWFDGSLLVLDRAKTGVFIMDHYFHLIERFQRPDNLFMDGEKILTVLNKYDFVSYITGADCLYLRFQNLKRGGFEWQDKAFDGLKNYYRIDTIYGEVSGASLTVNLKITNKDGSEQELLSSFNIETGEEVK